MKQLGVNVFDSGLATSDQLTNDELIDILIKQPEVKSCQVTGDRCISVTLKEAYNSSTCFYLRQHLQQSGVHFDTNKLHIPVDKL